MSFYQVTINRLKQTNSFEKILYINIAVFVIIKLFLVVFAVMNIVPDRSIYNPINYLSLPADLKEFKYQPWTVLTYMFLHKDFLHIVFNMLWFYWFGKLFVAYIGAKKITGLYIIGGIFGAIFFMSVYYLFPDYFKTLNSQDLNIIAASAVKKFTLLGASASVIAVVVAISTYMPNYKVNLMFIGDVKIKYIALLTVVVSLLSIDGDNRGGEIAHLGGAFFGFIYAMQFKRGKDLPSWFSKMFSSISFSFKRKPKMKATYNKAKEMDDKDYNYDKAKKQKEIDAVLDKISKSGYESLSKKEKEILFNSSKPN